VRNDRLGREVGAFPTGLGGIAAGSAPVSAAAPSGEVLCVHFAGAGDEHSLWLAGPVGDGATSAPSSGVAVLWHRGHDGVARGEIAFHRAGVADVIVLAGPWDRASLRALGLSRRQAGVLAPLTGRPVLATFARGPAVPPDRLRRIHRHLLDSLGRWDRLRRLAV
jgi:hypothetical protein